ncbi:hypothetical protein U6G28_03975 [Actinomycetaceae bacterium MB13-C1-2]|nr:hypothetical protein U6G28_03975 [Actinomycetaceae bacterium MB13-C1-2]
MSDDWYWVRSAQTRVDTEQVVQASNVTAWAAGAVGQTLTSITRAQTWTLSPFTLAMPEDPFTLLLVEEQETLSAQCKALLEEIRDKLIRLQVDIDDHAEWLSMAALIYASADADAATFFEHCDALRAVSCGPGRGRGLGELLGQIPHLVSVMGLPDSEATMQTAGLETESQLREVAAQMSADPSSTARLAGPLASLWLRIGGLVAPSPSGVVVVGEGKVAWGRAMDGRHSSQIVSFSGPDAERLAQGFPVSSDESRFGGPDAERSAQGTPVSSDGTRPWGWPADWNSSRHPVRVTAALAGRALARAPACVPWPGPPTTAAALLRSLENSPRVDGIGEIQILRHDRAEGDPSWSVVIRGTQEWLPGSINPQDLMSNFEEVAGKLSDQHVAVLAAMDLAGIQPGATVEFVGHSQGGAVALSVAASEQVSGRFNVVSVLTAGGPVGSVPDPSVRVLALENTADIVPALDGRPSSTEGNHVVVHFDRSGLSDPPQVGAHGMPTYAAAAERLSELAETDPDLRSFRDWEQARIGALGLTEETRTASLVYATRRTLGPVNLPEGWTGGTRLGERRYQRTS